VLWDETITDFFHWDNLFVSNSKYTWYGNFTTLCYKVMSREYLSDIDMDQFVCFLKVSNIYEAPSLNRIFIRLIYMLQSNICILHQIILHNYLQAWAVIASRIPPSLPKSSKKNLTIFRLNTSSANIAVNSQ
jgi:hypothetical protein